jgi:Tfp pilus assembly protein PilO
VIRAVRTDRLWAAGGALAAVALLAIGWFLLISPQRDQTAQLAADADTAQQRLVPMRHRLVELRQQNGKLAEYEARLARGRQALPTTSGITDFLRELETGGTATGVTVTSVVVGSPTQVPVGSAHLYALPITLVGTGTVAQCDQFLDQLQQVQPRAVLVSSVNEVPTADSTTLGGTVTLTVGLQTFVAPPAAATPAPEPS